MRRLKHNVLVLGFVLLLGWASASPAVFPGDPVKVSVKSEAGKTYDLNLKKSDNSLFHHGFQYISIGTNKNGEAFRDVWAPSAEELKSSQNVLVDEKNFAVVRVYSDSGKHKLIGVVDGMELEEKHGSYVLSKEHLTNHSDYIDLGRPLTFTQSVPQIKATAEMSGVIEILVVLDKEFGDVFQHDRTRILNYLTVYFWDINMRYKTLPNVDLSFHITGIIAINDISQQPFIEDARAPDGRAEFGRILDRFSEWVYSQMNSVPKFDMAPLITNTQLEWGGGLAWGGGACWINHGGLKHYGTTVFNDGGNWGSLTVGAHEMAHTVGAPHDDDPNIPGGCDARGYIMSGGSNELRWFFSTCSDKAISDFVRSDQGSCLRQIDYEGGLPISPDFSAVRAPTMNEQCKRMLNDDTAYIEEGDTGNCLSMRCLVPTEWGWWVHNLAPADNTQCLGGGRCFRGRCLSEGSLVVNVGSGQCLRSQDKFNHNTYIIMNNCVRPGTPLDRFRITDNSIGKMLATPFQSIDAKENSDVCIWTGNADGDVMFTDRCSSENPWHGWNFVDVGNGEFLICHRLTNRCAKQEGTLIRTYTNYDRNDPYMHWKLE